MLSQSILTNYLQKEEIYYKEKETIWGTLKNTTFVNEK